MRAHASPRRRPWNRRLHVHAHTDVGAPLRSSACVCCSHCRLCVGSSPPAKCSPSRSFLLAAPRWAWPPSAAPPFRVRAVCFPWLRACRCLFLGCSCAVVFTPPTGFRLALWDGGGAAASQKLVGLAAALVQPGPLLSTAKQMLWR